MNVFSNLLSRIIIPIHHDGHKFILAFAIVSFILFQIWALLGWLGTILTIWCIYFFRNPERITRQKKGLIMSPADGVICKIAKKPPPIELRMGKQERICISVFMNVFDCHVNRAPAAGKISSIVYSKGKFFNASLDKASEKNERNAILIDMDGKKTLAIVQIAGLVARRIMCYAKPGERLHAGQVFGLIRFGSRVDVYLPIGAEPLIAEGQRAIGGETVFANLHSEEIAGDILIS
ncbi:MAG: phosphatidylserine decarboxylase [Parvibaculales bacterium]